jgi:hypothetical protein
MKSQAKTLKSHRLRQRRRGLSRVEVTVQKQDAPLIRDVAKALNDPSQSRAVRMLIREKMRFHSMGLKELLASAPLEGVDLTRPVDFGREVEL